MATDKINNPPTSTKDQLLDRLQALDTDHPDYETDKQEIERQLTKIAQDPQETINAFNILAESKLSPLDKYQAKQKEQTDQDQQAVSQLLQEINSLPPSLSANSQTKQVENQQFELAIYFRQVSNTAKNVKKAIRAFNWRSLKQLSRAEKDTLCAQIDNIETKAKVAIAQEQKAQTDTLTINRLVSEARYQIQKIADEHKIHIPGEY